MRKQVALCLETEDRLELMPILLLRPGIGKTHFAKALAQLLGTAYHYVPMSSLTAGWILSGASSQWKNAKPGKVFDALVNGSYANPVIAVDEIDKAGSDAQYDPLGALYALLEHDTARAFIDEFAEVPIDAGNVIWIATANEAHAIPEPLLNRMNVCEIEPPDAAGARRIAQTIYDEIRTSHAWGRRFPDTLGDDALDVLAATPPRTMRRALLHAFGAARLDGATRSGRATSGPTKAPRSAGRSASDRAARARHRPGRARRAVPRVVPCGARHARRRRETLHDLRQADEPGRTIPLSLDALAARNVMEQMDCVVIGAGVVGLAIARELAARGRETLVLEAADAIGTATSSRNSEVIHAGSLSARVAEGDVVRARARPAVRILRDPSRAAPARRQAARRHERRAGEAVEGDRRTRDRKRRARPDAAHARRGADARPALECVEALFSPSTGIVDSHQLMLALLGDAERDGAVCALKSPVESIDVLRGGRFVVRTGGDAPTEIEAACVINSAGLGAQALARRTRGLDPRWVPPLYLARGNYFSLSGRAPFSHLIYPMPDRAGRRAPDARSRRAGALRRTSNGSMRCATKSIRRARPRSTRRSARSGRACPTTRCSRRTRASGRSSRPGEPPADFIVQGAAQHGVRAVNLFGIESPGHRVARACAAGGRHDGLPLTRVCVTV